MRTKHVIEKIEHLKRPKKIVCVDLDGVILSYQKGWVSGGKFGKPVPGVKEALSKMRRLGFYVVVYTVRGDVQKIDALLKKYGIPYDSINWHPFGFPDADGRKPGADVYIDDRAICFEGNWEQTLQETVCFRRWEE